MPVYLIHLHFLEFHLIPVASISGFYVYIILLLYKILDNDDLKKRMKIMEAISDMVDFQEDVPLSDPNKTEQQQFPIKINTYGIDLANKVDITCPISLETWDNARRIALILDREKSQKFEISYIFLCVYFFFLVVILGSIFADVYVVINKSSKYAHPILIYNFTIDACLILGLFLIRI